MATVGGGGVDWGHHQKGGTQWPGLVNTELYTTIGDEEAAESLKEASKIPGVGRSAEDVAEAVAYAVGTPDTVAVSELIIRPTNQEI